MGNDDLDRALRDVDVLSERLAPTADWGRVERGVRRALSRPRRELLAALGLVAACAVLGVWTPIGPALALGVLLAAVPGRVAALRRQRRGLAAAQDGDLVQLVREELVRNLGDHVVKALAALAFASGFALFGLFVAADPVTALVPAAVLVVVAAVRLSWFVPRASRALTAFDRGRRQA